MSRIIKSSQLVNIVSCSHNVKDKETTESVIEKKLDEAKRASYEIVREGKQKAEEIVRSAEKKSEEILENTYLETNKIIEHAKENGFNEGFQKGYEEGKKVSDLLISEANQIKKNYFLEREKILTNLENDVISLVLLLCEKILNQKLHDDRESIISIVLKGIENINVKDSVVIRVSAEDYDIVELAKERILSMANLIEDISVKLDNTLSKGGCIIESSSGSVDAGIQVQINEMRKTILNLLNGE